MQTSKVIIYKSNFFLFSQIMNLKLDYQVVKFLFQQWLYPEFQKCPNSPLLGLFPFYPT